MQIPKTLKIGGHDYTVELAEANELGSDCVGKHNKENNRITIDSGMTQTQIEATFFHELIHALNDETSETDTEFLAQGLYAVLKNNDMLK